LPKIFGEFDMNPPAPATDSVASTNSYFKSLIYLELTRLSLLETNCYVDGSAKSATKDQKN